MNQSSESKRQYIGVVPAIVGEVSFGNRQGLLSLTKTHWGWCLFIELNILCNLEAPKLLLWRLGKVHFALVVQTRNVLIFPDISKKDSPAISDHSSTENTFVMPSKQRKHSATHQCSGEEETGHWCLCHNDRRHCFGKESRVAFLSQGALGIGSIYRGEWRKQPCLLQYLVFWSYFNGHSALVLWTSPVPLSLLVQTRHGLAQSAISWKENMFEVLFRQWEIPAPNQGSEAKRCHFGFCVLIIGEV